MDLPRVEGERELVGPCEAVTGDLVHPAENFTLCQRPPQVGHYRDGVEAGVV